MLATRLSHAVEPFMRTSQYGFRRHRSTTQAVHVVRRLMDALFYKTDIDLNLTLKIASRSALHIVSACLNIRWKLWIDLWFSGA